MSSREFKICASSPSMLHPAAWPMSLRFRRQCLMLLTRLLTTNTTTVKTSSQSRWRITRSATQCGARQHPSFLSSYLSRQGQSSRWSTRRTLKYPSRLRSRPLSGTALRNQPFILLFNWASTATCSLVPLATSNSLVHVPMQTTFGKTGQSNDGHPRLTYPCSKNPNFAAFLSHSRFRPTFLAGRIFFISLLPCRLLVTPRQRNGSSTSEVQS